MFRDRQIPFKCRIPVFIVDWSVRIDAPRRYKQFLKSFPPTKFLKSIRMTVIEMLVSDKDVIIDWFYVP